MSFCVKIKKSLRTFRKNPGTRLSSPPQILSFLVIMVFSSLYQILGSRWCKNDMQYFSQESTFLSKIRTGRFTDSPEETRSPAKFLPEMMDLLFIHFIRTVGSPSKQECKFVIKIPSGEFQVIIRNSRIWIVLWNFFFKLNVSFV